SLEDVKVSFPWGKRPMVAVIPHDGRFGAADVFERYGYEPVILPRTQSVIAEIEKVRMFLGRVRIDNAVRPWTENEENNARLVEALYEYRTERSSGDPEAFQRRPAHTWSSHWADSVRYGAVYLDDNPSIGTGWGPPPDYSQADRIARTVS